MIISVSRRTDIPAYYSEWFIRRVSKGYCHVPNPFNSKQIATVSLLPEDVTAIAFWTRNPEPMLSKLKFLDDFGYHYYFMITLNNYPRHLEANLQNLESAINSFLRLSEKIGCGRVVWRYDPLILTENMDAEFHLENFKLLARMLRDATKKVITSIITPYRKTLRNFLKAGIDLTDNNNTYLYICKQIKTIARANGMESSICCPPDWITKEVMPPAKCIDSELLNREFNLQLTSIKDKSQRKNCNCYPSKDIGMNNSCIAACMYCYATQSFASAMNNHTKHNIESGFLIGDKK